MLYLTVFMKGQRVIRSDTAHSAHIHGYQHITIYVHSPFATNASLSILSVCTHTQHKVHSRTPTRYQLCTYITTYVLLNQRHYIPMIISCSKELRQSQPLQNETTRSQKIVFLKNSTPCMWSIQYERILIPCMKNVTIG